MRSGGRLRRRLLSFLAIGVPAMVLSFRGSVHAATPVVTISATGTKIQVTAASLTEAIDALARAAGFKVTYEGGRPNAMLFNAEIDTPTIAQTLFRLLDGQNLNYGVVFDLSGKKVTSLMVLGAAPKTGGAAGAAGGSARPQLFPTPRGPRNNLPPVDEEFVDNPEPTPQPTPSPSPAGPPRGPGGQGSPTSPFPPSPFAPRPPYSPFPPRPSPSPSP